MLLLHKMFFFRGADYYFSAFSFLLLPALFGLRVYFSDPRLLFVSYGTFGDCFSFFVFLPFVSVDFQRRD